MDTGLVMPDSVKWMDDEYYQRLATFLISEGKPVPPNSLNASCEWLYHSANRKLIYKMWKGKKVKELFRYLITFTLKPQSIILSDKAEEFVRTQALRKGLNIVSFHYVKELTKNGVPHFHAVVESRTCIKHSRFIGYEKLYGKVDISQTRDKSIHEAINYISKDATPIKIV